jgi:RNA polymerase-binding transcription factor
MNTEHYKQLLLAKQQDLLDSVRMHEEEARDSRTAEVEDEIDRVISAEGQAAGFQEATLAAQTLTLVREALERIENGTYGKSLESGEPLEPARLEAVPWAQYSLKEQERIDREAKTHQELDSIS